MNLKIPYLIVLTGMLLGVLIAIFFGFNEDIFKNRIASGLESHPQVIDLRQSEAPEAEVTSFINKEASKNWRYYQRFHFHSTGIGAMSLGLLLLLSLIIAPQKQKIVTSYLVAVGGFLYPFVWLFAAIFGPTMGRTAAKETFAIFGYMGGVFLLGIGITIYLVARYPLRGFVKNS